MLLASNISKSLSVQLDCKVRTENRLFLICDTGVTVCFFSYVVLKQVPVYDFYHMSDICRLWLKKENS